ncbi:hypothetical protein CRM22_001798 [Opisthorchis felineus]|uniref:C3H1-type domain-containing protein n=1 Tax=Opisthorchis felineus TaxID=147828 RepID=A0A4S2MDA6_OPIFE|nr:hypothetical protein CRM22_001798 [Opisthorchis felineus]
MYGCAGHPYKWVPNKAAQPSQRQHKYKYVKNVSLEANISREPSKSIASSKTLEPLSPPFKSTSPRCERAAPKRSRFKYVSKQLIEKSRKSTNVFSTNVKLTSPTRQRTAYKYVRRWTSNKKSQASKIELVSKQKVCRSISTRFKYNRLPVLRQIKRPSLDKTLHTRWERGSDLVGYKLVSRYAIRRLKPAVTKQHLPSAHHYRRIVRKAVTCLRYRRRPICRSFAKTGRCDAGTSCRFVHDENYLRICPRFLSQRCALGSTACPLAHVLDPCRIPVCEFHESKGCTRSHCPYLHVTYPANAPLCPDFLRGRCRRGRLCDKRHAWHTKASIWRKPTNKASESTAKSKRLVCGTSVNAVSFKDTVKKIVATLAPPSDPVSVPQGSLRHVYPAPAFIPLLCDDLDQDQLSLTPDGTSLDSQDATLGPTRIR